MLPPARTDRILSFDRAGHPFDSLVLGAVNDVLQGLSRPSSIDDLARLHTAITPNERRLVENAIYALFGTPEFQHPYDALCAHIVESEFGGRAAYQRTPSVRIHMPGAKSVNYHTDEWYGHGHDVRNFWMPLVAVAGTNSMYVLDEAESLALEREMRERRLSVMEMNVACHGRAHALSMTFGEMFAFNSHVLHGTVENETDRTRVSIDFRMLLDGADRGIKDPSFFIHPNGRGAGVNETQGRAGIYIGKARGVSRIVSQKYQQLLGLRYAEDKHLAALALETELSTFDHYPALWDLITGSYAGAFDTLIFFSVQLLPADRGERHRLLDAAAAQQLPLHFVCEDLVWRPGESYAAIDDAVEANGAG